MCDIVKQKRINMQVTKTLVYLCQIVVYLCQAVRICKHSEVTMVTQVFIETADVPQRQRNICKCNVIPAFLNSSVSLKFRKHSPESEKFYFKLHDIVLKKTEDRANLTFTKENELDLETGSDFNMKNVCLIISTDGKTKFNISCEESQWAVTQSMVPEITISELKTSTNSTLENSSDVDICTIGIATGGIVCIIVELVAVLIICYKRGVKKQKKNVRSPKLSQEENETSARNDGGDNDYYMTENPLYNMTEPIMDKKESPLYSLVQKRAPNDERRMEAYNDNPDLPNILTEPLVFQQTGENNIVDFEKFGDATDSGYTEIVNIDVVSGLYNQRNDV